MTNSELMNLSIEELRTLSDKITDVLGLKLKLEATLNKDNIYVGAKVRYIGRNPKINNPVEIFVIEKINKVNAVCRSEKTNIVWNINIANIKRIDN